MPVVGHEDRRRHSRQRLLEQFDAGDVQVVGRLVEQQQFGLERKRQRERTALGLATRGSRRIGVRVEPETLQVLGKPGFIAPPLAIVGDGLQLTAQDQALAHRLGRGQHRLLLDRHHAQAVTAAHLAVVQRARTRDHGQQRRLAGAVSSDQPDAFAGQYRQGRPIEQRQVAEGQLGVEQIQQGNGAHGETIPEGGAPPEAPDGSGAGSGPRATQRGYTPALRCAPWRHPT